MKNNHTALKRQQLLKRIFPALAVLVIYFGFVGPKLNAKVAEAELELERKKQQYQIDQAKFRELTKRRDDLTAELDALRKQGVKTGTETAQYIGFQGGSEYAGHAIGRLNELLAQLGLRVIEDGRQDWSQVKDKIPATVYALGDQPNRGVSSSQSVASGASVWKIRFSGPYVAVYRLLDTLSRDELTIVPVALEMTPPENGGDMEWVLLIWI